jgi:hypothetical protein
MNDECDTKYCSVLIQWSLKQKNNVNASTHEKSKGTAYQMTNKTDYKTCL